MKKDALWTKSFIFISLANFFVFVSYYSLLVTLPQAMISDFGTSATVAGLFTTVFLGAAIIIRPFLGFWIDRYGKRAVLMGALILFTTVSFLYGLFESIIVLLILRFLQGLGFGLSTAVAGGIVADIVPDSRKGEGMGYFILSNNVGMVAGPFIGLTLFGNFNIYVVFWVIAICSLSSFLFGWFTNIPADKPSVQPAKEKKQPIFEKAAVPIGITGAFFAISYSSILSFMAVFAAGRGMEQEAGYFFAVYAVILLLSRPFTGVWFDRYGPNVIIFPSIVIFALGMLTLGLSHHAVTFFIAAGLIGLGWGTLFPSFQTLAVQHGNPKRTAISTATYLSIFDIGIGGGSFLVGLLAAGIDLGALYIYFSIYILAGLLVYYFAQRKKKPVDQEKEVRNQA